MVKIVINFLSMGFNCICAVTQFCEKSVGGNKPKQIGIIGWHSQLREAIGKKRGLTMDFFRKGSD